MAGPRIIPRGSQFWPEQAVGLTQAKVVKMYRDGFAGAYEEPEERERFESEIYQQNGTIYGGDIATASGFADSGKGQLCIPFVWALIRFPGCWPGPAQQRGDCVSHDQKNANMLSYACELQAGEQDEVTGLFEEAPEISRAGLAQGGFSTEVFYWYRRHGGDGWSCDAAARVAMNEAGLVPRGNIPDVGDLTTYSGRLAGRYGRTPPSGKVADALDNNLIRRMTVLKKPEERRDFLHNGFALSTCGSEGFSSTRDENGVSRRSGSWAHAYAFIGFDDRPWAYDEYGTSLDLGLNSWGVWNRGPRDIQDSAKYVAALYPTVMAVHGIATEREAHDWLVRNDIVNKHSGNIMIPHGAFWQRSNDVNRRRVIAKSSVNGWPKRRLPSLGEHLL